MTWMQSVWAGFVQGLQNGQWFAIWIQAIGAFVAVPVTWLVAARSTRHGIMTTLGRDLAQRAERRAREKTIQRQRREHLATQLVLCIINIEGPAKRLGESGRGSVEDVFKILTVADLTISRVCHFKGYDLDIDGNAAFVDVFVDDVERLLNHLQIDIQSVVHGTSYGQLRVASNGISPLQLIGDFVLIYAGILRRLLEIGLVSLELGEDWSRTQEPLIAKASGHLKPPQLPPPLVAIRAQSQSPGKLIADPRSHPARPIRDQTAHSPPA